MAGKNFPTKTSPQISIVRCASYSEETVKKAVRESITLIGGFQNIVKFGDKVLIKPNLLAPTNPNRAVTTHPSIVEALVNLVQESGAVPWIGDSSGGPFLGLTSKAFKLSGIASVAKKTGAVVKNFDVEKIVTVENPSGKQIKKFQIARPILEADVVISAAKCKIHELLLFTGAVKNLVGAIPGGGKRKLHFTASNAEKLSQAILDLYQIIPPQLSIMDAVIGLEGRRGALLEGAGYGYPRNIGLIMAGQDAIALDAITASIIGYDPLKIGTIRFGQQRGLGTGTLKNIVVVGEKISQVRVNNFLKTSNAVLEKLPEILRRFFIAQYITSDPWIDTEKCKKCGICEKSCPVDAITLVPLATIKKDSCIKCYCCHELCVNEAINLKKPWLAKYLLRKISSKEQTA